MIFLGWPIFNYFDKKLDLKIQGREFSRTEKSLKPKFKLKKWP